MSTARSRFLSFSGLAAMFAGNAVPAAEISAEAPAAPAGDPAAGTGAAPAADLPAGDYVLAADAVKLATEAGTNARAAEAKRWNDVLSSEQGRANPADASFLLFHSNADAAAITAQLGARPAAAAPAAAAPSAAATAAASLAATPKVDIAGAGAGGAARGTAAEGDTAAQAAVDGTKADASLDPWKAVQGENALTAGGQPLRTH